MSYLPTDDTATDREKLLGQALLDVLKAAGMVRADASADGPMLLAAADDFVRLSNPENGPGNDHETGKTAHAGEDAEDSKNVQPAIVVTVEGGLVQGVCSTDPDLQGKLFAVIDYDTEGADPETLTDIVQADGSRVLATFWSHDIVPMGVTIQTR